MTQLATFNNVKKCMLLNPGNITETNASCSSEMYEAARLIFAIIVERKYIGGTLFD